MRGGRGPAAGAAAVLTALALAGFVVPSSAAEPPRPAAHDHDHVDFADDTPRVRLPDGRWAATDDVAPRRRATQGWTRLDPRYRFRARPTYKMRLADVGGYDAGQMRGALETMVLRNHNVDITVAPGTVSRTKPRRGEILVQLSPGSPCARSSPDWVGCAGPKKLSWVRGSDQKQIWVGAGKIWIRPNLLTEYPTLQYTVYLHELGHVLGMGHYDATYDGAYQVMRSVAHDPINHYQAGDRNGLTSARPLEKGYRNFRSRAVTAVRFKGRVWLFGADATGNMWVRRPRRGGGFRWEDLDGVLLGAPGVVAGDGRVDVFAVGTNGDLYQKTWADGAWSAWVNRLQLSWTGGVTAMAPTPGRFHVWGRASDRQLAHAYLDANNQWVANSALGGTLIDDVAVLHLPHIPAWSVWGIGTNRLLYQKNHVNGGWGDWTAVAGSPADFDGALEVDRDSRGRYHLFGVTTSGDVRHTTWTPGVGWKFRKPRSAAVRGRIGALEVPRSDRYQLFAPDLSGHLRTSVQRRKGWSGFEVVPPR